MIPYFYIEQMNLGLLTIHVWGLFIALGIFLGTLLAIRRGAKLEINAKTIIDCAFWLTLGAFVGGKGAYLLFNGNLASITGLGSLRAGFSSLGAVVVGLVVYFFLFRRYRILPSSALHIFAPALLLADGIGRIGCFLLHEHLGRVSNFFLAVNIGGVSRHDLGLYFALSDLLVFFIFLYWEKTQKITARSVGWRAPVWYFASRFLLEFLYENGGQFGVPKYLGLTLMQVFSVIFFVTLAIALWKIPVVNKNKKTAL